MKPFWVLLILLWLGSPAPLRADPVSTWWGVERDGGIIGRVYLDNDGDGKWSEGDQGLPGARVLLDTGEVATTDPDGRFHLFLLPGGYEVIGSHLLKVDRTTIPANSSTLLRRWVEISPGEVKQVDFALKPPSQAAPMTAGVDQAEGDIEALLAPDATGKLVTWLAGRSRPGCQLVIDGLPVESTSDGLFKTRATIVPGVNPHLISVHCPDGHLEFLLAEVHRVHRAKGGDLVIPSRPRTLATCQAPPPALIPKTPAVLMTCHVEAGVSLRFAEQQDPGPASAPHTWSITLGVHPGENQVAVRTSVGDEHNLIGRFGFNIDEHFLTGALLGSVSFSYGEGSGGGYGGTFGGKLDGVLRAELPQGFKLILGGGSQSIDMIGLSAAEIFTRIAAPTWNPWRAERDPDPESTFLIPGDSGIVDSSNPPSSRYFLLLSRKSSSIGWGGFGTDRASASEVGNYRRSLLGAHGVIHPLEDVFTGDKPTLDLAVEGFYANPEVTDNAPLPPESPPATGLHEAPAHEEFMATGGTLYFLHHSWVIEGSARLQVQRRDVRTGLAWEHRALRPGIDYQVDWLAGRILLTEPLDSGVLDDGAVRLVPTGASASVLVVDYEYLAADADPGAQVAGGRASAKVRLAGEVSVQGGFSMVETVGAATAGSSYRLLKGEARTQFGEFGSAWAAYANSSGNALVPAYSVDGGLSFQSATSVSRRSGEGFEAGAVVRTGVVDGEVLFRRWLDGFSDTNVLATGDLTQLLATATARPGKHFEILGMASGTQLDSRRLIEGSLGLRVQVLEQLSLTAQAAMDSNSGTNGPADPGDGKRLLAGLRATYQALSWLGFTAAHQQSLWTDGSGPAARNLTLTTAGGQIRLFDQVEVGVEGGWGPEVGNLVRLSVRQDRENGEFVFAHTTFSVDRDALRACALTTGESFPGPGGMLVTNSQNTSSDPQASATGQRIGFEIPIQKPWILHLAYARSDLESPANLSVRNQLFPSPFFDRGISALSGPGRRNAVNAGIGYLADKLQLSASGEYRVDEQLPLAFADVFNAGPTTHRQTVLTIAGHWTVADGIVLGGRFAWAETLGTMNSATGPGIPEGGFLEGSFGVGFRPSDVRWLRFLIRTSAGRDLRPEAARSSEYSPETWVLGSAAILLFPTKYFQPTLAVAPLYQSITVPGNQGKRNLQAASVTGMLRIGSEIYGGLGLAAEGRLRYLSNPQTIPDLGDEGFKLGAAAEAFYQFETEDYGGLRLSAGYSFSELPDPMSDLRTGQKGLFIRLEGML